MSDPRDIKLEFQPSKSLPRKLLFRYEHYGIDSIHANCHAFVGYISIAYAGAHSKEKVSLKYTEGGPILWLASAQFSLTPEEASEVERAIEPLGICIVREVA